MIRMGVTARVVGVPSTAALIIQTAPGSGAKLALLPPMPAAWLRRYPSVKVSRTLATACLRITRQPPRTRVYAVSCSGRRCVNSRR